MKYSTIDFEQFYNNELSSLQADEFKLFLTTNKFAATAYEGFCILKGIENNKTANEETTVRKTEQTKKIRRILQYAAVILLCMIGGTEYKNNEKVKKQAGIREQVNFVFKDPREDALENKTAFEKSNIYLPVDISDTNSIPKRNDNCPDLAVITLKPFLAHENIQLDNWTVANMRSSTKSAYIWLDNVYLSTDTIFQSDYLQNQVLGDSLSMVFSGHGYTPKFSISVNLEHDHNTLIRPDFDGHIYTAYMNPECIRNLAFSSGQPGFNLAHAGMASWGCCKKYEIDRIKILKNAIFIYGANGEKLLSKINSEKSNSRFTLKLDSFEQGMKGIKEPFTFLPLSTKDTMYLGGFYYLRNMTYGAKGPF